MKIKILSKLIRAVVLLAVLFTSLVTMAQQNSKDEKIVSDAKSARAEFMEVDNTMKNLNFAVILQRKSDTLYLPCKNRATALYERVLPPVKPQNFVVRTSASNPSTKLIATWDKCSGCDGYALTRTDMSAGVGP